MAQFQIKRGYKKYLLDDNNQPLIELEEGCWYLTLDTAEVFIAIQGVLRPLNQANIDLDQFDERFKSIEDRLDVLESSSNELLFADFSTFPEVGDADKVYIAVDQNQMYIYRDNGYQLIHQKLDVERIVGGSAII